MTFTPEEVAFLKCQKAEVDAINAEARARQNQLIMDQQAIAIEEQEKSMVRE